MAEELPRKSRILLLISEDGGYKSASISLQAILGNNYEIETVNLLQTVLHSIDWFKILSLGKFTGEDCYHYLLRKRHQLLPWYMKAGGHYMMANGKKIAQLFENYLTSQHRLPELIISTIPLMNHGLLQAADRLGIPFCLLATDLDSTAFIHGFQKLERKLFQRFKLALAFERPEIVLSVFKNSPLEPRDLVFPGFPVHPACQRQYPPREIVQLKSHYGLSSGKKILSIVMDTASGKTILEYAKILADLTPSLCGGPIEANLCLGQNKRIHEKLVQWAIEAGGRPLQQRDDCMSFLMPKGTVLHIRGYSKDLILIMACSDLVISKTGSCILNEAVYLGKKILIDNTLTSSARSLDWEQFNVHFIKRHGLGSPFTNIKELSSLIPFMLNHVRLPAKTLKLPDFQTNITQLVSSMMGHSR